MDDRRLAANHHNALMIGEALFRFFDADLKTKKVSEELGKNKSERV